MGLGERGATGSAGSYVLTNGCVLGASLGMGGLTQAQRKAVDGKGCTVT